MGKQLSRPSLLALYFNELPGPTKGRCILYIKPLDLLFTEDHHNEAVS